MTNAGHVSASWHQQQQQPKIHSFRTLSQIHVYAKETLRATPNRMVEGVFTTIVDQETADMQQQEPLSQLQARRIPRFSVFWFSFSSWLQNAASFVPRCGSDACSRNVHRSSGTNTAKELAPESGSFTADGCSCSPTITACRDARRASDADVHNKDGSSRVAHYTTRRETDAAYRVFMPYLPRCRSGDLGSMPLSRTTY